MTHQHLDMNSIIQKELQERRAKGLFQADRPNIPEGARLPNITVNEGALLNAEHGPQQVESLLRYVVDIPTEKALADAVDDLDAVRHLNDRAGYPKYTSG